MQDGGRLSLRGGGPDGRNPSQPVAGCSRLAATRELPTGAQRIQVAPDSGGTAVRSVDDVGRGNLWLARQGQALDGVKDSCRGSISSFTCSVSARR
jgi:hypothetical protein